MLVALNSLSSYSPRPQFAQGNWGGEVARSQNGRREQVARKEGMDGLRSRNHGAKPRNVLGPGVQDLRREAATRWGGEEGSLGGWLSLSLMI